MSTCARIAACLAALWAYGGAGIQADESEPFTVSVRLEVDPSISSRFLKSGLEAETASIWSPYGVRLEWIDAGPDTQAYGFSLEAIVEPRIQRLDLRNRPNVLGLAEVELDAPSGEPIRVSLDSTETLLAFQRSSGAALIRLVHERELARALGRVLAHEIGHMLLGVPYHDDAGLMRAVFRPDELAAPDRSPFRLTCTGVGRLKSRVRRLARDPRFARRQNGTAPEHLAESQEIARARLDPAACVQGRATVPARSKTLNGTSGTGRRGDD